ncbi:MAG: hypothetical protein JSS14_24060 [Proteobacteria bacterium]|nr:hypothetical protein [Pseudomonadota bacterium]
MTTAKPAKRSGQLTRAQLSRMRGADGQLDLFVDELHDARVKAAARGRTREYESRKAVVRRRTRDPEEYTAAIKRAADAIKY